MSIWKVQKNTQNSKIESKFINPFQTVRVGEGGGEEACRLCPQSRAWLARFALRNISYWQAAVTLYFDFRQSMIVICDRFCSPEVVINGSCGSYESFLVWGKPFPDCGGGREGGLWTVFKVDGSPTRLAFRGCFCGFCGPGGVLFGLWIALSSLWGGGGGGRLCLQRARAPWLPRRLLRLLRSWGGY